MNKVALVTGGNRGIGSSICKGLAFQEGTKVLMACRDYRKGLEAKASIPYDVEVVELDLSSEDRLSQISEIYSKYGDIDILVNNAGILIEGDILTCDQDVMEKTMEVNFFGPYDLIKFYLPKMNDRGYGRIVNISSGWGSFYEGLGGPHSYSISKAALNALTKTVSLSAIGNVKINSMCPGWVRTNMGGMNATRSPDEAAETAIWLANIPANGPNGKFFRDNLEIKW